MSEQQIPQQPIPLWVCRVLIILVPLALCIATGYSYYLDTQFITRAVPVTATVMGKYANYGSRNYSYYIKLGFYVETAVGPQYHENKMDLDAVTWNQCHIGQHVEIVYLDNLPTHVELRSDYKKALKKGYSTKTLSLAIATLFCLIFFFIPRKRKNV